MGSTITFRRGENDPTSGSGLTLAEPAFNTTLHTFHIGLGHGITAEWVGAPISGLSAEIAAGITYKTPTLKAVKDYVTDYVTAVNGVLTVNGFAGGVTLNAGTALGLTSSSGNITLTNLGVQSFNGLTGTVQGVSSWNGQTGAVSFSNYVVSFNGLTGTVGGVCAAEANTFTAVQTFNSGVTMASTLDVTGVARLSGGVTASRVDVTGNFKVVGDAQIGDQNTDTFTVFAGTTFNNRVDFGGTNVFRYGLTSGGAIRFSGNNAKSITTTEASLTITGVTSSGIASPYNSMVFGVQTSDPLTMYSATGVVDIATNNPLTPVQPALRFNTDDQDFIGPGSIKVEPNGYATGNRTQYLQDANGTLALTSQLMGAVNGSTAATSAVTSFNGLTGAVGISAGTNITITQSGNTLTIASSGGASITNYVESFNGLTGAVTGVTVGGVNTFTQVNTFSAGISAAGSTFASTTNTLDVIASTEGAGLRIARATSGVGSRIGGIRLGRSATSSLNTYIEGSSGTFSLYNGVDNTGTLFAAFSPTQFSLGTTSASFITLNSPNIISFGDQSAVGNNQAFSMSGTARTYTFGDSNGVTAGFVGINRSGLCADYALEVNSPTGKGLQLIYNDHTGAASNWVNMDVSSGGNFTVRPSGGLATVTGTLNVSAGVCAAGITLPADGKIEADGALYIGNNPVSTTRVVIGDYDASGNSTYILVRDPVSALDIVNPSGSVRIGDPDGIVSGNYFSIDNSTGVAEIGAGSFTVNAGISAPNIMYGRVITNITGATTALNNPRTDYVYNATSGTFTLTMPTAASNTNRYTVKNSGTGIVTIGCTASQTIDGDSTYPLSTQYQAVDLISNGTNWIVV